jgi:uncharacterized protein (DUF1330 family)
VPAAYFIAQVEIHDQAGYERYSREAAAAGMPPEMKIIAMDENPTLLEGKWHGPKTVILEFPSEAALRKWYDSPGYQAAKKIRTAATVSNVVVVHGIG